MEKKDKKNKKFEWKYVGYFFGILFGLFVVIFLINLIIVTEAPFKVAQDNDWIGFWGGVLGAILSGLITFIVLRITIDNENQKREEDRDLISVQRLEDRRMSILPYLNYTIVNDKYIEENNMESKLKKTITIQPKLTDRQKMESFKEIMTNVEQFKFIIEPSISAHNEIYTTFNLIIENLGLGLGIEPKIVEIYNGTTEIFGNRNGNRIMALNVGERSVISFCVIRYNLGNSEYIGNIDNITLKIRYFNIIRDYYEQEVVIDLRKLRFNRNREIVYEPVISSIGSPKIIEDYKNIRT